MSDIQVTDLQALTANIMGNLKVLWRSTAIDDGLDENPESLFTSLIGDGGDRYLVENLIHQVAELNKGLGNITQVVKVQAVPNPLSEKLKAHYDLALSADSLAELLDKSDLFTWLTDPEMGAVNGSLTLLFELVAKLRVDADDLCCQASRS